MPPAINCLPFGQKHRPIAVLLLKENPKFNDNLKFAGFATRILFLYGGILLRKSRLCLFTGENSCFKYMSIVVNTACNQAKVLVLENTVG